MTANHPVSVAELEKRATALTNILLNVTESEDFVKPSLAELLQAFADAQMDIWDYCEENRIKVTGVDSIKLLAFSIPHLRRISPKVDIRSYLEACILLAVGRPWGPFPAELEESVTVCEHLSKKYPPEHIVIYAYLKGLQEAFDVIWHDFIASPAST